MFRHSMPAVLAAALCVVSAYSWADPEHRFSPPPSKLDMNLPPTNADSVQLLTSAPKRAVVQLGSLAIKGDADHSGDQLISFAKRLAAERGADFIVISNRSGPVTSHSRAPPGGVGGFGMQRHRSTGVLNTVDVLLVGLGGFPKAALGVEFANLMQTGRRMVVQGFKPASKASDAGVALGDEIVLVDGLPIDSYDARWEKWRITAQPGQIVRLTIRREGAEIGVDVPLIPNEE